MRALSLRVLDTLHQTLNTTPCVFRSLRVYAAREDVGEWMPYTVVIDDPTGNSQIEGEAVDSALTRERYLEYQIKSQPLDRALVVTSLFLLFSN
jgi:C4-type Zn-finger protein